MTDNTLQEGDVRAVPAGVGPPVVRIPLRDRWGKIHAHALVDAEDVSKLLGHRWYCTKGGYAARNETVGTKKQRTVLMARVILGLVPGDGWETDHMSRDKLDNRRVNLRRVTHAQNSQKRKRNETIPRGVSGSGDRWQAYGSKDGVQVHLGFHRTMAEAALAAKAWRRENLPYATD